MELRQLEYFVAVAAELNFSRAAQRIHVVQSALSASVGKLEKELEHRAVRPVQASDRAHRRPARPSFSRPARCCYAAHRAQSSVDDYRGQLTGTVTLGTLMSWGALNLPPRWNEFRRVHPLVTRAPAAKPHGFGRPSGRDRRRPDGPGPGVDPIVAVSAGRAARADAGAHGFSLRIRRIRWPSRDRVQPQPSSTGKISSSSQPAGESGSASMPPSPPPASIRSAPTRSPTTRSPPSSSGTDWQRRSCPSARQTGFPIYARLRCTRR